MPSCTAYGRPLRRRVTTSRLPAAGWSSSPRARYARPGGQREGGGLSSLSLAGDRARCWRGAVAISGGTRHRLPRRPVADCKVIDAAAKERRPLRRHPLRGSGCGERASEDSRVHPPSDESIAHIRCSRCVRRSPTPDLNLAPDPGQVSATSASRRTCPVHRYGPCTIARRAPPSSTDHELCDNDVRIRHGVALCRDNPDLVTERRTCVRSCHSERDPSWMGDNRPAQRSRRYDLGGLHGSRESEHRRPHVRGQGCRDLAAWARRAIEPKRSNSCMSATWSA